MVRAAGQNRPAIAKGGPRRCANTLRGPDRRSIVEINGYEQPYQLLRLAQIPHFAWFGSA